MAVRFTGLGWHVIHVADANDLAALRRAYQEFQNTGDRPTMIIVRSHIGYGAPTSKTPRKPTASRWARKKSAAPRPSTAGPSTPSFWCPTRCTAHFAAGIGARGRKLHAQWRKQFDEYAGNIPELAAEWQQMAARELPTGWDKDIPEFPADAKGMASRISSGKVHQRSGQERALADRRGGRPGPLDRARI